MVAELQRTAGAGAQALVVITFEEEAVTIVREAIEHGLYDQFTFGDASKSPNVVRRVGGKHLGGMYGTAGAAAPGAVVTAGPEGVAEALRILAAGGAVNYEGAAATLDWDENGDLKRGHIGIWRFTPDARIETLDAIPFAFEGDPSRPASR